MFRSTFRSTVVSTVVFSCTPAAWLFAQEPTQLPSGAVTAPVELQPAFPLGAVPNVPAPPKSLYDVANKAYEIVPQGRGAFGVPMSAPTFPEARGNFGIAAANDLRTFTQSRVNPAGTNPSTLGEPATASHGNAVIYTGNTYAGLSTDGGSTWTSLNPGTLFPNSDGGLCCDQKVIHVPAHDVTIWLLEYRISQATQRGRHRIAFARGEASVASSTWTSFDIDPQRFGFGNNLGLDFGDICATGTSLLGSALVIDTTPAVRGTVLWRINLTDLLAGRPAPIIFYTGTQLGGVGGFRFAQGPTGSDVFWAAHQDTSNLRIYRWNDFANAASFVTRSVAAWSNTPTPAPGPDNRDWTGFAFTTNCVLAGFATGNEVGFLWSSGAHAFHPLQYIRIARFDRGNRNLIAEHEIWNAQTAFHFPSACGNDRGGVGGTFTMGGGNTFPTMVAFVADDIRPWGNQESFIVRSGARGPGNNRWGDYQVTGRHSVAGNTWVGTGFVIDNTGAADHQFVWFGRERDRLVLPLAVRANLAVGASITVSRTDVNGARDGTTNFTRSYEGGQLITLTAPRLATGWRVFDRWVLDNVQQPVDQLGLNVRMATRGRDAFASYVNGQVIHLHSSETAVPIAVSRADAQGLRDSATNFTRVYKPGTQVSFTAPANFNGRPFWRWESSIAPQPPEFQTTVTVNFGTTLRAVYGVYVPGSFVSIGSGCAGTNGLVLTQNTTPQSDPEIGTTIGYQCYNARAFADGFAVLDMPTNQLIFQWIRVRAGCSLYAFPVVTTNFVTNAIGLAAMFHQVPNNTALIGTKLKTQFFVVDQPGMFFGQGTISSNGIETTLGGLR
jgi:hypothetical protein